MELSGLFVCHRNLLSFSVPGGQKKIAGFWFVREISIQANTMTASTTYLHITTYHYNDFAKVTHDSNALLSSCNYKREWDQTRPSSILGSELVALTTMLEAKPVHPQTSKMEDFPTIVNDFRPLIPLLLRFYMPWSLTHLFPMHPFSTSSNYQKTVRFSDIFRG